MSDITKIEANLDIVKGRIAAACERAGRKPDEVTLIAVTKTVGNEEVAELARLGVRDFGENRVVSGCSKVEFFAEKGYNWHFIGHLQRNKAAAAIEGFHTIHSVESPYLLKVLQKEAAKAGVKVKVYLEVNISGEESKYGLVYRDLLPLLEKAKECPDIEPVGLMCMAPFYENPADTRPVFRKLYDAREKMRRDTGFALPYLSMGMSNDYEIAVEEGATHVRVGSALFCD